jgi:hypothetical protein
MRTRRSLPWLLMLFLLAAGVAGMHTLGHAAGEHAAAGHGPAVHVMGDAGCCGDPAAMPMAATGRAPGMPMTDPTLMCLAILGAAALICVALILLARRGSSTLAATTTRFFVLRPGRGPPRALLGLTIADLSVLRN